MEGGAYNIAMEIIGRGWCPVPVRFRTKKPIGEGWNELRINATSTPQYFNGSPQNVGVLLGDASNGLIDVDLDCPEALALAADYLPPTGALFGRDGKPKSHWLYKVKNPQPTDQYRFPSTKDANGKTVKGAMIVEYRSSARKPSIRVPLMKVARISAGIQRVNRQKLMVWSWRRRWHNWRK